MGEFQSPIFGRALEQIQSLKTKLGTNDQSRNRSRELVRSLVIWSVVVIFIALGLRQLMLQLDATPHLASAAGALAGALAVVYRILCGVGWSLTLDAFREKHDREQLTRIWLISESRRWLPGGVWGYASRGSMAEGAGVPLSVGATSMLVELMILLAASVVLSVPGVVLHWSAVADSIWSLVDSLGLHWWFIAAIGGGALAAAAYPKFKKKFAGLLSRLGKVDPYQLDRRAIIRASGFITLIGLLNGLVTYSLVYSIPDAPYVPFEMVVAATAIAWVVGLFALFSPGGLVVREGVLAALLLPWLPYSTGFTVALLARLVQIFAELTCLVWVAIGARRKEPQPIVRKEDADDQQLETLLQLILACQSMQPAVHESESQSEVVSQGAGS